MTHTDGSPAEGQPTTEWSMNVRGKPDAPAHWCRWENPGRDSLPPAQNLYKSAVKKLRGITGMGSVKHVFILDAWTEAIERCFLT